MKTIGPVAVEAFKKRFVLERGRDSMALTNREKLIAGFRGEIVAGSREIDTQDSIVCHLISLGARLLEEDRPSEAHQAFVAADEEVDVLLDNPWLAELAGDRGRTLRAGCRYNMAVLYFEQSQDQFGISFLEMAVAQMNEVTSSGRGSELWTSLDLILDRLGRLARSC